MRIYLRAHNEEENLPVLLAALAPLGAEMIVVVSGCEDATVQVARGCGARVILAGRGMGVATCVALRDDDALPRLLLDADLERPPLAALEELFAHAAAGRIARGRFDRPGRASSFLAEDAQRLGVDLPPIAPQCLTTAYQGWPALVCARLDLGEVPPGYGADLALSILTLRAGFSFAEVGVGPRAHAARGEGHVAALRAANVQTLEAFASPHSPL